MRNAAHVMTEMHFLLQKNPKKYHAWSCQNVCDALTFLLDNNSGGFRWGALGASAPPAESMVKIS